MGAVILQNKKWDFLVRQEFINFRILQYIERGLLFKDDL